MTRILVPLPYDVSDVAHGRNLRVVNLLDALSKTEAVTCLSARASIAERARRMLPRAEHMTADQIVDGSDVSYKAIVGGVLQQRAVRFFSHHPTIERATERLVHDYDVVLGFDLPALASLLLAGKVNSSLQVAFDAIDDPWLTWSSQSCRQRFSPAGLKSAAALRVIRRDIFEKADVLMVVAPRDAETLARASGRPVEVIPNGIHMPEQKGTACREPLIVFTGAMSFPPNEAAAMFFLRKIWPRIRRTCATELPGEQPRFCIVGARPSARLRRRAESAGVEVTGYVKDLGAWLRRARVAIAPMVTGSGMKNKILEACAAGCPVVTTPLGAAGLPIGEAHGILCAETPAAFAASVVDVMRRPAYGDTLGDAAARMVASRFTWQASVRKLRSLLKGESLAENRPWQDYSVPGPSLDESVTSAPDAKETIIHAVS